MYTRWMIVALAIACLATACTHKTDSAAETTPTDETAPATDTVTLSPESMAEVQIETAPVKKGSLPMTLRSPGRISVNVNRTAKVTTTFEGRIASLRYDVGAVVQRGDVMGLVESPELLNRPLELKAPIDGQVIDRDGTVGEAVDKTNTIYTISDLKNLWCIAEVKERDIADVRTGQRATIRVIAYPGRTFTGIVVLSGQEVEERTRTLEARIDVDNKSGELKPGMFADVEILTNTVGNVLMVPDEALQTMQDQRVVFIAGGANSFIRRVVTVGREQGGQAEILSGVEEGEIVVTRGSFVLKSELLKGELGEE